MVLQNQRIQNVHLKMEGTPSGVSRNSNQRNCLNSTMCRSSECFKRLRPAIGQWIGIKKQNFQCAHCGRRHNKFLRRDFSKNEAASSASDAPTAVATMIKQGGPPVVRIKLMNGYHRLSVLAMFDKRSSISFVDKSIVFTLPLQGRKAPWSIAAIHG